MGSWTVCGGWWRFVRWLAGINTWLLVGSLLAMGFLADRLGYEAVDGLFFIAAAVLPFVLVVVPGEDEAEDFDVSRGQRIRFVISMIRLTLTPWGLFVQFRQLGGQIVAMVRYRRRYPNRDRHVPETTLRLPVDGEWTVVNGGVTQETSHSWELVSQRYAYDFLVTDEEGNTHADDGSDLEDYYAYGEPVLAPADGTVVAAEDSLRDYPNPGSGWMEWKTGQILGNHVVVEHAEGEYSTLAHLQEGSVSVDPGESVEAGDAVGRCGNSGNSSEPHLHYQLQDVPSFWTAAGLVPRFAGLTVQRDDDRVDTDDVYDAVGVTDSTPDQGGAVYLRAGDEVSQRETE